MNNGRRPRIDLPSGFVPMTYPISEKAVETEVFCTLVLAEQASVMGLVLLLAPNKKWKFLRSSEAVFLAR